VFRQDIPASRLAAWQEHMKALKAKAKELFEVSPRCHRIQCIDQSTVTKIMSQLPRHQAALLVQFRVGHIPLQKYLHKVGKAESARCHADKPEDEMVHHFLLMCPAYTMQQNQLAATLQRAARSVGTPNPESVPLSVHAPASQC